MSEGTLQLILYGSMEYHENCVGHDISASQHLTSDYCYIQTVVMWLNLAIS